MIRFPLKYLKVLAFLSLLTPSGWAVAANSTWETLERGLELASFPLKKSPSDNSSFIRVLRIDPQYFEFQLLNASRLPNKKRQSAKQWVKSQGLTAAINASMYQKDHLTSVSLMKTGKYINNSWFSKDKAMLAFHPVSPSLDAIQILDRDCQNLPKLRKQYNTLIQSIRMISCDGKNVWGQSKRKWSMSAIGQDKQGRVLFIHVRAAMSTHDLINHLLRLPLHLERAMYTEGGPEAQMYVQSGDQEHNFIGNFNHHNGKGMGNTIAWPIPNVIGIHPRNPKK